MKTIDLSGKTALVTGASSGIGQAIAVELARCGAVVIVNYRHNEAGAHETLTQIQQAGGTGQIMQADVSQASEVIGLFSKITTLDILVNNAGGLVKREKIGSMDDALWAEVMAINVTSTFLCCRAAIPLLSGHGWGRIVNMSSVAAHDGAASDR